MTDPMQKHEQFMLDTLLPLVFSHARAVRCAPEESAMACFLTLATVLQSRGLNDADLLHAIRAASLDVTHISEILQ